LVGIAYAAAGVVFGALAGGASTHRIVVAWRLAAWIVSIVAFAAHIAYERLALGSSLRDTAMRVALAAGLGAFGLAVAAKLHGSTVPRVRPFPASALVIWPVITAIPAFVVALALGALSTRIAGRRSDPAPPPAGPATRRR
jgi:hypothetical protein